MEAIKTLVKAQWCLRSFAQNCTCRYIFIRNGQTWKNSKLAPISPMLTVVVIFSYLITKLLGVFIRTYFSLQLYLDSIAEFFCYIATNCCFLYCSVAITPLTWSSVELVQSRYIYLILFITIIIITIITLCHFESFDSEK